MKSAITIFFLSIFLSFHSIFAIEELPEIQQITTHPQRDFQPAVSPNGKWLAYVSSQSGNLDIWIKPLPRGRSIQITADRSEDLQPVWMPNSEEIVFMSKRRDAMGDLWRIRINGQSGDVKGVPEQLTAYLGWDQSPSISPGGRYVAFVSDRSGGLSPYILDLESQKVRQLVSSSGIEPAWSPDGKWIIFISFHEKPYGALTLAYMPPFLRGENPDIHLLTNAPSLYNEPEWSPDGRWIVYQRIDEDTNGDGKITPEDYGSLWEKQIFSEPDLLSTQYPESRLTPGKNQYATPAWHDTLLYFMCDLGEGEDIWVMPQHGLVSYLSTAEEQYMAVFNRFGTVITPAALQQALLGYQRVLNRFPGDSVWCARSWIRIGELEKVLSRPERARLAFEMVRTQYGSSTQEAAEATVKQASIEMIDIPTRIRLCESVFQYSDQLFAITEAGLLLGDLYKQNLEIGKSMASYSAAVQSGARYSSLVAQAKLKIGDLFQSQDQPETARQYYLAVLREYGDTPLWRQRATQRIMEQIQGSLQQRIAAYQDLELQASDMPALVAEAQIAIGKTLIKDEQYGRAIRELEQVPLMVPEIRWAHAEAYHLQATAFNKQGDFLKAQKLLERIMEQFDDLEAGKYQQEAAQLLFEMALETAETLKSLQDYPLAASRYQTALQIQPHDIRANRGLVESSYYWQKHRNNGKLDSLIHHYKKQLVSNTDQPVIQYSLGLALSYSGEKDISVLEQSNQHLLVSLESDYRLIYPYRTLGYNYELMERLSELESNRRPNLLQRTGKIVLTPFRWIQGVFERTEKSGPVQYYEKAIEVLTTAVELNNEKEDPRLEAEISQNLANNFYNMGEYGFSRAFRYYQKRLSLDTTFSQSLQKAVFFSRAGHAAFVLDEYNIAEEYLKIAIDLFKKLGREQLIAEAQGRLAYLYQLKEDHQEAISLYETLAIRDRRELRWDAVIRDYRNIAYNYHLLWEPEDAIRYAKEAEKLLATQEIPKGPPEKSYLRWEFFGLSIPIWGMEELGASSSEGFTLDKEAALNHILISKNAERLKDFNCAEEYERKRLQIFQDRKDKLGQRISLNRLGMLLMKQNRFEEAWREFHASYKMCHKAHDSRGRWMNVLNLGQVTMIQVSLNANPTHLTEVIDLLNKENTRLQTDNRPDEREAVLSMLGTLNFYKAVRSEMSIKGAVNQLRLLADADQLFIEAFELAVQRGMWREQGILLKSRAEIAVMTGDDMAAIRFLNNACALFEKGGEDNYLWRVRYTQALICTRLSQSLRDSLGLKDANEYFQSAVDVLEAVPVSEENSELRLTDRDDRLNLYEDAAIAYAADQNPQKSLQIAEQGRKKRISDVLAWRPPQLRRERHKNLWLNIRDTRAQLGEIVQKMMTIEAMEGQSPEWKKLQKKKQSIQADYQAFMMDMEEEDPVLAYLSGASPIETDRLQYALNTQGCLYFLTSRNQTLIFAIDSDTLFVRMVPLSRDSLEILIDRFNHHINQPDSTNRSIALLSEWLISPVASWLQTKTKLVLVPDDCLWELPFEMLKVEGEPLVDLYSITYAPSLMAYQMAYERRKINQSRVLLLGDTWNTDIDKNISLPHTFLAGPEATESNFKNNSLSADIVHFERWMLPNENNPLQASIILFESAEDDGYVRPEELFSMDLQASLIKLPAARTLPAYQSLELYYYSLLYAGVPTILISRWPTSNETNIGFAQDFYRRISDYSYAEALNRTQIQLRDQNPGFQWAAFGLMGYEGMDVFSRGVFARQNLVSTVIAARNYLQLSEYRDAVSQYEKALNMAESLGDSASIRGIVTEMIRASMQGEIWDKAIHYQERFIDMLRDKGQKDNIQTARQNLVTFYFRSGQFEEAAEAKKRILQQYRAENRLADLAQGCMDLAVIYASARNYKASVEWADEAFNVYMSLEHDNGKAKALIWKGRALLDSDRFFEARSAFSFAIEILEKSIVESGSSQEYELSTAYQLRGICYENLSYYEKASQDQQKSLELLIPLNRPLQLAQGHQYLANVYWKTGAYRQALVHQKSALDEFEKQKQRKHLAMAYSTQGLIQMSLGDIANADASEEKAYGLALATGSKEDEATILKNMGQIAIQEQDLEKAFDLFRQATVIDSTLNLERGLSYDYRNLGMLLIQMSRYEEADYLLRMGLVRAVSVDDLRNQAQCYYGLSLARMRSGRFNESLLAADSGLVLTERMLVPELAWRLHRQRGQINWTIRNLEQALADFQAAVEIVEEMRAELKVEAYKQGFFDSKMDLYHDIIDLLIEMNRQPSAFQYVERAKSRDFIDMLANQRVDVPENQMEFIEEEQRLKMQIQEVQHHVNSYTSAGFSPKERRKIEDSVAVLQRRYQSLIIDIQSQNPELASMISVNPWDLEKIQSCLKSGVAVIEYFWGAHSGYCWVITQNSIEMASIDVPLEKLNLTIQQFRDDLESFLSIDQSPVLYEYLIKPVEMFLKDNSHIVIIPHGSMHYLPFAALQNEQGYLIERFSISLAPSSTVLGYCLEKGRSLPDDFMTVPVLAFGNPDLGNPAMDLEYAEKEIVSLKREFPQVEAYLRQEANEQKIKQLAGQARILHFACHATYESETPLSSALLLSSIANEDGRLEAQEIFGLHLNCDLVTLSACETGLGHITLGDEIIGLSRSFIYAGAPSILTSLWKVDDLSTAVMMKRFYRNLASGKSRTEALRQAQLTVREFVNPHPSAWAAFNVTGDFR